MAFDQRTKRQYIEYLRSNKLISENDYLAATTDELFNKYYFTDQKISLKELIGIQYLNNAIYLFNDHKLKEGYNELEKAYIFYPCEKTKFLLLSALTEIIGKENFEELPSLDYFVKLTRFGQENITTENVRSQFALITNFHLINRGNKEYYDKIYQYLTDSIKNEDYLKEISFLYNYESGRYLLNRLKVKEALPYFEKAYSINPDNTDAQMAFVRTLASSLQVMNAKDALPFVENYMQQYEKLKDNYAFNTLVILLYLGIATDHFNNGNIATGDEYLLKFEQIKETIPAGDLPIDLVADAYSSAGMHYFRRGNYKKAKEYIKRGLVISPNNPKLIYCLSSFE